MTTSDNISLIKRWYREVWWEGRDETIFELLAPDAVLKGQTGPKAEIRHPHRGTPTRARARHRRGPVLEKGVLVVGSLNLELSTSVF